MDQQIEALGRNATVIVVGGGVSGCACAATLAAAGVRVLVVSKALDTVGLPAYGPDLVSLEGGLGRVQAVLDCLPSPLREVWSGTAAVARRTWGAASGEDCRTVPAASPEDTKEDAGPGDEGFANVDRRVLSIETKRMLETMPGLQFRQGLVDDVRTVDRGEPGQRGRVAVETVFGEVFVADAVVLAVGLSMGGEVTLGEDRLPGGRYGEIPSDGLVQAMRRLGVELDEVELEVGGLFLRSAPGLPREWAGRLGDGQLAGTPRQGVGSSPGAVEGLAAEAAGESVVNALGGGAGEPRQPRSGTVVPVAFQRLSGRSDTGRSSGCQDAPTARGPRGFQDWPSGYPVAPHQDERLRLWRGLAFEVEVSGGCGQATDSCGVGGTEHQGGGLTAARAEDSVGVLAGETGGLQVGAAPASGEGSNCVLREAGSGSRPGRATPLPARSFQGEASGCRPSGTVGSPSARLIPWVSPDGLATGEVYVSPRVMGILGGCGNLGVENGEMCEARSGATDRELVPITGRGEAGGRPEAASRLGYRVRGLVVRGAAEDGRVLAHGAPVGPVWVAGRAGGATDYVESLSSGVRVAHAVISHVDGRR